MIMRKFFSVSVALVAMAFLLSGCNCYNKMMKRTPQGITVSTAPELVTLKGDNAVTTLTVNFPAKTFHKWGVLKVTPVLVYPAGESAGEPKFLQGEKVKDNYTVISHQNGGSYTQQVSIPYKKEMRLSELMLKVEAKCVKKGKKIKNFTEYNTYIPVAKGVSSLQLMADYFAKGAIAPDAFKRTTEISESARIMFVINKSDVRPAQLNSSEVAALEKFITDNQGDPKRAVGDVYTQAYASPEGPLALNTRLSNERGSNTEKAVSAKFKKDNVSSGFDVNPMGEDWEGFQDLVAASDIPDKNIILQVLSMYNDPQTREREIKSMSAAYKVLADKILPELRRAKMTVPVTIQGKTDDELRAAVNSNINSLNVEEMLFSATLYKDDATKQKIYQAAADKYNDYRAWNNLGVVKANQGDYAGAKTAITKASSINNSSPQVINNLGLVALVDGQKAEAAKYFAASTAPEAKYNKGLVELANGNYGEAIKSLDGYNKALAELLNGNVSAAKSQLSGMDTWRANYLKAVIAAREGNASSVYENLRKAVSQNRDAGALALTDVEFWRYHDINDFTTIVSPR